MTVQNQAAMRFAIYCRYSNEVQNEVSLESQEAMCREEIIKNKGVVVAVYRDAAQYGWSLKREGFLELRVHASEQQFDAIMMWKFDRLARDHTQVTMIKALLRYEYGIQLYCVEGFSEDDNDSTHSLMMEQMLSVFSEFYSMNLSSETKRANRHRHTNGKFNGGRPPFGYLLATEKTPKRQNCFKATEDKAPGLYIEPIAAKLVRYAFDFYAKGDQSYRTKALILTKKAHDLNYSLEKPFNPHMVRELLQNKIYCGYVSYVETIYRNGFGQTKAGGRNRKQWTQGIHDAIISEDLFEKVQVIRNTRSGNKKNQRSSRQVLLSGLVFCAHCLEKKPKGLNDDNYGKLYSYTTNQHYLYYECSAKRRGYSECGQTRVKQSSIDKQVISALHTLYQRLPEKVSLRIEANLRRYIEQKATNKRMKEIQEIIERIDLSWEDGFTDKDSYIKKRNELRREMKMLESLYQDEILKSSNLLRDFYKIWEKCTTNFEKHDLLKQIIDQVVIKDDRVVGLSLKNETAIYL